eukprot:2418019-Pyramimonas_sp.AAC.1
MKDAAREINRIVQDLDPPSTDECLRCSCHLPSISIVVADADQAYEQCNSTLIGQAWKEVPAAIPPRGTPRESPIPEPTCEGGDVLGPGARLGVICHGMPLEAYHRLPAGMPMVRGHTDGSSDGEVLAAFLPPSQRDGGPWASSTLGVQRWSS